MYSRSDDFSIFIFIFIFPFSIALQRRPFYTVRERTFCYSFEKAEAEKRNEMNAVGFVSSLKPRGYFNVPLYAYA